MSRKSLGCTHDSDPLQMAGRRLGCETIMFHQAVADRLGLNVTDHKCLDFLLMYGPSTAGELSHRSSLTTGAITAVIDRLERAGFVRREADPSDRRRVIVSPVFERLSEIGMLFADLGSEMGQLAARYSRAELDVIIDFMNRSCGILREAAVKLRVDESTLVKKTKPKPHEVKGSATTKKSTRRRTAQG